MPALYHNILHSLQRNWWSKLTWRFAQTRPSPRENHIRTLQRLRPWRSRPTSCSCQRFLHSTRVWWLFRWCQCLLGFHWSLKSPCQGTVQSRWPEDMPVGAVWQEPDSFEFCCRSGRRHWDGLKKWKMTISHDFVQALILPYSGVPELLNTILFVLHAHRLQKSWLFLQWRHWHLRDLVHGNGKDAGLVENVGTAMVRRWFSMRREEGKFKVFSRNELSNSIFYFCFSHASDSSQTIMKNGKFYKKSQVKMKNLALLCYCKVFLKIDFPNMKILWVLSKNWTVLRDHIASRNHNSLSFPETEQ